MPVLDQTSGILKPHLTRRSPATWTSSRSTGRRTGTALVRRPVRKPREAENSHADRPPCATGRRFASGQRLGGVAQCDGDRRADALTAQRRRPGPARGRRPPRGAPGHDKACKHPTRWLVSWATVWRTQWTRWLREGRACLPREPYPRRARRPPRPHRFERGDGSPGREREILSVSVRTALRRALGGAQTPRLTERKRGRTPCVRSILSVAALPSWPTPSSGPVRLRTTGFGPGEGGGLRRGQATLAQGVAAADNRIGMRRQLSR
jgi:hypothetical protein